MCLDTEFDTHNFQIDGLWKHIVEFYFLSGRRHETDD